MMCFFSCVMLRNYTGRINYPPTSNEFKWRDAEWNDQKLLLSSAIRIPLFDNHNNSRPMNVGVTSVAYVPDSLVHFLNTVGTACSSGRVS